MLEANVTSVSERWTICNLFVHVCNLLVENLQTKQSVHCDLYGYLLLIDIFDSHPPPPPQPYTKKKTNKTKPKQKIKQAGNLKRIV